jgi:hypothetical protein
MRVSVSRHWTQALFDRSNIVSENDVREAAKRVEAVRDGRSFVRGKNPAAEPRQQPRGIAMGNSAPGRERSCSLWVRSPTLYPIELRALVPAAGAGAFRDPAVPAKGEWRGSNPQPQEPQSCALPVELHSPRTRLDVRRTPAHPWRGWALQHDRAPLFTQPAAPARGKSSRRCVAPGGTRTPYLRLRRPLLYPGELLAPGEPGSRPLAEPGLPNDEASGPDAATTCSHVPRIGPNLLNTARLCSQPRRICPPLAWTSIGRPLLQARESSPPPQQCPSPPAALALAALAGCRARHRGKGTPLARHCGPP